MSSEEISPLLGNNQANKAMQLGASHSVEEIDESHYTNREGTVEAALLESFFDESHPMPVSAELKRIQENQARHIHLPWYQKPSTFLICLLIMLIALAETLYMTPIIIITKDKVCESISNGQIKGEETICDPIKVQTILSEISSMTIIISGVISTFMAGKMGELSDRFGRVHVFIYIGLIRLLGNAAHVYALWPSTTYYKWFIILAGSLNSFSGGMYAIIANANSYLSDIVEPENRSVSFGKVTSALFATMGVGFLLASNIVTLFHGNNFAPIYFAISCSSLFILLCLFFIKETRHEDSLRDSQEAFGRRMDKHFERLMADIESAERPGLAGKIYLYGHYYTNQALHLLSPLKTLWISRDSNGSLRGRHTVILLLVIDIAYVCSTTACMPPLILLTTYKYNWQTVEIGYFVSFSGISKAVVLLLLSPYIVAWLKKIYTACTDKVDNIDMICIRISMVAIVFGISAIIFKTESESSVIGFALFQAFSAFLSPTIQSTVIKYCPKDRTGQCFGGMALVRSLTMLVFPPLLLKIYGATVAGSPEVFLWIPMIASIISVVLSLMIKTH
ncbi:putative membrane protein [Nakaseomyces glabratus]|uniref:Putative membrane protein n=1 Tax=Candida glabrata TaxID=5478 RepID=A0A0W0CKU8_CANGB|nr:putative membrane protein [Nakaseomyces glabratus]KTB04225.1 putative membrane protein [Nakaseomyces glabratus]KTB06665.1 putative membrane protein [Nakaseomyces glabratus]KTB14098.1 putative membrane protein [Nakaseomyces glabratus]